MSDPADLNDRLNVAVQKAENGAAIYHDVANGPENVYVDTLSGPVPTLLEWQRAKGEVIDEQVAGILQPALDAADRAELAAANAAASANQKPTVADGLATTEGSGPNDRFFSVPGTGNAFSIQYRNDGGVAVEIGRTVSAETVELLQELIAPNGNPDILFGVVDDERNRVVKLLVDLLDLPFVTFGVSAGETIFKDAEGNVSFKHTEWESILGHLKAGYSPRPGLRIIDEEYNVINDLSKPLGSIPEARPDPFEGGLLFEPVVATAAAYPSTIYPASILTKRNRSADVVATLAGGYNSIGSTTGAALSTADLGENPVLNLRSTTEESTRRFMRLTSATVPTQSALPLKVLLIGDSIANRQGGTLLKKYLEMLGAVPFFIGTMKGSDSPTPAGNALGELGEAREGWETGDYTNAITDRAIIIPPGGEAEYLALSKINQRDRNPFARAATGSDSPSIVRNGYVADFAFYQSRFGLETPDVVLYMMGTNDVRDRAPSVMFDTILSNDTIILSQMRAAWPDAKIIRSIPGTAYEAERNELWEVSYAPAIRAMRQAISDLGDPDITLAPLWAMMNPEGGYAEPEGSPDSDGFLTGVFSDTIHPIGSTRDELYKAMAPFVLAAKLDLI